MRLRKLMIPDIMTLSKTSIITFLMISLFSCSDKQNEDYFKSNSDGLFYKVKYQNDTIFYLKGHNNKIDTSYFVKGKDGYYDNIKNPFEKRKSKIVFSTQKDTLYYYKIVNNNFYCSIKKIAKNKFITTYGSVDSLNFKYKHSIYYDDNYRVQKIEETNPKENIAFMKR